MVNGQAVVLNHQQIEDRITRIAWQIFEDFAQEKELILAGIAERGYVLASLLQKELAVIAPFEVSLVKLVVNKPDPLAKEPTITPQMDFTDKHIVVIDDVLNKGTTLLYGVRYFLDFKVKGIKTAVLVDRSHKSFPIKGDFKGISLSTGIMEHVEVQIATKPYSVEIS